MWHRALVLFDKLPVENFQYRGQTPGLPHLSMHWGIQGCAGRTDSAADTSPTMYQDFLNVARERLQHWSSWPEIMMNLPTRT
ncbi:MAG: hypothetical protein CM1200mP18_11140 [Gammaproteobacteria bacterium]|nr:MAG: hypothetical protein CM1200mP18_11140 [Gammaproteobacteria bacterium]